MPPQYRDELSDLATIVSRCRHFLFILTDNIFDSPWCMLELGAAVQHGVNVVLLTKEGARWPDDKGAATCMFPPQAVIGKAPEAARAVFTRKSIQHSDEYYAVSDEPFLKLPNPWPNANSSWIACSYLVSADACMAGAG